MVTETKKNGIQSPTGTWKANGAPKVRGLGKQVDPYGPWAGASKAPSASPGSRQPNPVPFKR